MTRVAIVAGAASGGGLDSAVRLAQCGLDVALIDAEITRTGEAVGRSGRAVGRCAAIKADVADTSSFTAAVDGVRHTFGTPSVLLTCVPLSGGHGHQATHEERCAVIRRSLRTLFVCCQAVAGHMVRQRYGRILNVAMSVEAGEQEWRNGQTVLGGLIGFTRSVALELATFGVTANFIAPTSCASSGQSLARAANDHIEPYSSTVARLAEFLISDGASAITGQGTYVTSRGTNVTVSRSPDHLS